MSEIGVVSPAGLDAVKRSGSSPRLESFSDKTIGEIWNGVFKGDQTFPMIRELLKKKFPSVKIIPYTEFPHNTGTDNPTQQRENARRVAAMAKEKGCHAVITGMGA
jgi:hypothetical protein